MKRRTVVCDSEFERLVNPQICWVIVCRDVETKEKFTFVRPDTECNQEFRDFCDTVGVWIGANFVGFDRPNINRVCNVTIPHSKVVDLQVVSRLVWFARPGGHSVENFAKKFGKVKPEIDVYDDPNRLADYVHRCEEDVDITFDIYNEFKRFMYDKGWSKSLRVEHDLAEISRLMKDSGFSFDVKAAKSLLAEIEKELEVLTNEVVSEIGDVLSKVEKKTLRRNKDGSMSHHTTRYLGGVDDGFIDGEVREFPLYQPFNPGSAKDRILFLNSCGWSPTEKTKTHIEAERELRNAQRSRNNVEVDKQTTRLNKLKITGWQCSETNLETLPPDAPQAAKKLAEWLTLEGRRADLQEWLDACDTRSERIHGTFWHIGAWTHRMSHSNPNQGNIFGITEIPKGQTYADLSPVQQVKYRYDKRARGCWRATPGRFLVGTDAEGIQLRVLAHYMQDPDYAEAVANGRKEDKSDVHNVNLRALGLPHLTRDMAKTFIYAFLLGAGRDKVASILQCTPARATVATETFLDSLPALGHVKKVIIPQDAKKGFFVGLDGRKVICDSEHLMLAGYLQNGEKCVMAHANVLWRKELDQAGVWYNQVNFVHDEWQTEAMTFDEAEYIGKVQRDAIVKTGVELGVFCPLAGTTDIGRNWAETH